MHKTRSAINTRKYENWNGSRWQYTRNQSQWHFDPSITGVQDFQHVCTFQGEWDQAVEDCLDRVVDATWATRNFFAANPEDKKRRMYTADAEEHDLLKAGADPHMKIFQRAPAEDIPVFRNIADYFGMTEATIKFHNQTTGQMLNWHIDNFAGRKERKNSFRQIDADVNPNLMRRFVIMLDDWRHGQTFALGNSHWHQWCRGECITWDWRDIPHATCNMGWDNRPMLQVTGWTTERTAQILEDGSRDLIVQVSNQ
jgi:hypothetical protein